MRNCSYYPFADTFCSNQQIQEKCIVSVIISGICMLLFGRINIRLVIIPIMLLLPLVVSVPAYIFDEMENKVIALVVMKDIF